MTQKQGRKYIDIALITALFVLAIAFRSYKITSPLIEYHSWRQADTAAVARNFARTGFDLLHPRYDDVSPLQTGRDNPEGYRMVEFPAFNALVAVFYKVAPAIDVAIWGRIVNTFFSLFIIFAMYELLKRESGRLAAVSAGVIFAVFPFFVFYTRAVLPEVMAIACIFGALYVLSRKQGNLHIVIAISLYALGILVKPTVIFFGLPIWYMLVQNTQFDFKRYALATLCVAAGFIPFFLWRVHIAQFPEGIPASAWLFTHVSVGGELQNVFFRPAFFRWILHERLNILILGSFGLVYFICGLVSKTKSFLSTTLLVSAVMYLLTFQGGNVQHEYYQIIILPVVAMFTGLGIAFIYKYSDHWGHSVGSIIIIVFCLVFGWFVSWDKVRHYYYSLSDIPQFATVVKTFVSPHDTIVVDTGGDTTALYAFDRKGSPAIYSDTFEMRNKGYDYLFTYNHETADNLQKADPELRRVFENSKFVLFKL